jgi:hypothetical protein
MIKFFLHNAVLLTVLFFSGLSAMEQAVPLTLDQMPMEIMWHICAQLVGSDFGYD